MLASGWRIAAIVWEREKPDDGVKPRESEVPYGFRIADDCDRLVEDSFEQQVLAAMLDLFAHDLPPSRVAEELNRRGYRTRSGSDWNQVSVFNMHPRLIEAGPRLVHRASGR
jgi:hypothetical protein